MTVKELIEELEKLGNKDMRVYFEDCHVGLTQVTNTNVVSDGYKNDIYVVLE